MSAEQMTVDAPDIADALDGGSTRISA